jgi:hypothetical protein
MVDLSRIIIGDVVDKRLIGPQDIGQQRFGAARFYPSPLDR